MGAVAVIGEPPRVDGFGLAGALVFVATTADQVRDAWSRLPADVDVVVLTEFAAATIGVEGATGRPFPVVLPV
ncbi:MAG TPA: V-type ATP synthase subunit F [Acidothermaceae bacterium]|nr:V-type ATP synthase subunit F [Acidothermaceae bacterium]